MKTITFFFLCCVLTSLCGCFEKNTSDPTETYTFWAGETPPKEVKIIHGKYWQSAHWSKEYEMYLELEASLIWRIQFVNQNQLVQTNAVEEIPSNAPGWFKPNSKSRIWTKASSPQPAYYYEDTINGKFYMYEVQY